MCVCMWMWVCGVNMYVCMYVCVSLYVCMYVCVHDDDDDDATTNDDDDNDNKFILTLHSTQTMEIIATHH